MATVPTKEKRVFPRIDFGDPPKKIDNIPVAPKGPPYAKLLVPFSNAGLKSPVSYEFVKF